MDDKEYENNLIYLLKSGTEFVQNNSKVRFEKKAQYRVDKPDHSEQAVTEALVNVLIHRYHPLMDSEAPIKMYNNRVEIYSSSEMYLGKSIQEYGLDEIDSVRHKPVIANLFHRIKFMERRGSSIKKLFDETTKLPEYAEELKPTFHSTHSSFFMRLKNINYSSQSLS